MEYEAVRLSREKEFSEQLRRLFNADVIGDILREGRVDDQDNWMLASLEGHPVKITAALAPRVHAICEEVKTALRFTEPVEFFVQSSGDLNCAAVPRMENDHPHLVIINSALLERFTDAELRFVLGHELGHLISKNSELQRIIEFVFPNENVPLAIRDQVDLWDKLSEMSADRFGFLAEPDIDVCLAVFFKLSSGLDTKSIHFDPKAYLDEMERVLEAFRTEMSDTGASHPVNPIRVKALQLFSESKLMPALRSARKKPILKDDKLARATDELAELLMTKGHSPLTAARRRFVASAGLMVASVDADIGPDEMDAIVEALAEFTHHPARYLRSMVEAGDVTRVFQESTAVILQANPSERYDMFHFMVAVALADRELHRAEVDVLFDVGEKTFELPRKEIAQLLASALQRHFVPRLTL